MWDTAGTGMGWWMAFGGLWMVIFWGGIIALIVWGIKKLTYHGNSTDKSNAMEIARARYAQGEITKKEFEQIKKDLF